MLPLQGVLNTRVAAGADVAGLLIFITASAVALALQGEAHYMICSCSHARGPQTDVGEILVAIFGKAVATGLGHLSNVQKRASMYGRHGPNVSQSMQIMGLIGPAPV